MVHNRATDGLAALVEERPASDASRAGRDRSEIQVKRLSAGLGKPSTVVPARRGGGVRGGELQATGEWSPG